MSRWRGARCVTSRPPMEIVPPVVSSSPAISRRSVDLPQPEGPTSTMNSPSRTVSETSSIARTPPANSFVTWSTTIPLSPTSAPSSLHRARRQAERDLPLDDHEEDQHGDRSQDRAGHQPAPVDLPARAVEVREPDGDRLLRLVVEQDVGEDELVPARDEDEHGRRDEAGRDEREQDLRERSDATGAVDHRRLLELLGDVEEKTAQRPDRERKREGHVREDHADVHALAPGQVVFREHDVERDDQTDLREHLDPDQRDDEELAAVEAELRERDRGEEGERDRDQHGDDDDDHAVRSRAPEVRTVHRVLEVLERRVHREEARLQLVELVGRLERAREHPVDREDHHHEDEQAENVPRQRPLAARPRRLHSTSPARTIWRT